MNTTRNRRLLLAGAGAFLIFLLAACGSGGTTSGTPTTTGGQTARLQVSLPPPMEVQLLRLCPRLRPVALQQAQPALL